MLKEMICATLVVFLAPVSACSYYAGVPVFFERNSAVISPAYIQKIAEWVVKIRATYPAADSIQLYASVEEHERLGQQLGRERELALKRVIGELGLHAPAFVFSEKIEVFPDGVDGDSVDEYRSVRRGDIIYDPVAPFHRGNCMVPVKK